MNFGRLRGEIQDRLGCCCCGDVCCDWKYECAVESSGLGVEVADYNQEPVTFIFQITMQLGILITILLLFHINTAQIIDSAAFQAPVLTYPKFQPCISYQSGNCTSCPYNYHINQNQCYLNITYCQTYTIDNLGQQSCERCDPSFAASDGNGACSIVTPQLTTAFTSTLNLQSVAQQYGDSRFQIIALETVLRDPYFIRCNNYMLTGEYSHFISRTAQPINAVSFFTIGTQNQYKILYYGSGGGLMMSIITISTSTNAFQLNSFVPIGTTNIIDYCGLYNEALQCVACVIGYHLQNNQCFSNIGGCISYSRNICLQCSGFSILIENRCVGCEEMGDAAKVLFWGGLSSWVSSNSVPFFSQNYLL